MFPGIILLLAFAALPESALAQSITTKAEQDEVAIVARNDPDMAAAMKQARDTLPDFLRIVEDHPPKTEGFAVKVAVREGGNAEYFWINPFAKNGDHYFGRINNTPRAVTGVKSGDKIDFKESDIVDWIYFDNGSMKGNYTACALLKKAPKREVEEFKRRFSLDCGL